MEEIAQKVLNEYGILVLVLTSIAVFFGLLYWRERLTRIDIQEKLMKKVDEINEKRIKEIREGQKEQQSQQQKIEGLLRELGRKI